MEFRALFLLFLLLFLFLGKFLLLLLVFFQLLLFLLLFLLLLFGVFFPVFLGGLVFSLFRLVLLVFQGSLGLEAIFSSHQNVLGAVSCFRGSGVGHIASSGTAEAADQGSRHFSLFLSSCCSPFG